MINEHRNRSKRRPSFQNFAPNYVYTLLSFLILGGTKKYISYDCHYDNSVCLTHTVIIMTVMIKHIIRTSANESLMKITAIEEVSFEAVEYITSKQALSFSP